jgi:hypothetical protein
MKSLTGFQPGNFPVRSRSDIPEALEALKNRPLYAEKWAHFKMVNFLREGDFSLPWLWPWVLSLPSTARFLTSFCTDGAHRN